MYMDKVAKLYIKTYGCQMNEYDTDKMVDVLRADRKIELTSQPEEADIILFNTCSIREKAEDKVFSDLGRTRPLKLAKPDLIIGVGGCVASQEGEIIIKRAPYVDVVFGPQTLHRLPQLIAARQASGQSQVDISFPEIEKFDHLPQPALSQAEGAQTSAGSAYVAIMEGCSKYCTFCVVPYTRGEEISRPFADVMRDVQELVAQGVGEITLLGQNVNAYTAADEDGEVVDFAYLLRAIAALDGVQRLRYTTSHPKEMTQRLVDVYASTPKLASHLHLPVQSGSDRVLAAMKRGYTALEYKSIIRKLRADLRFYRGFSGGNRAGFRRDSEADRRRRIRHELQFYLQPASRHASGRISRSGRARGDGGTAAAFAGPGEYTVPGGGRRAGWQRAARAGGKRVAPRCARAGRASGQQSHG
jgi:tRNA-2-methylthio-N6-dimethylallyladenosine synthase